MARRVPKPLTAPEPRMDPAKSAVPSLRFPEFRNDAAWAERPLGQFLTESRVPGSGGDVARKLTVKLWGKGVVAKTDGPRGSENTQYYRRRAGQFIYSKLDFLNQAFGIIPQELDGYESTVDLPCFDVSGELNTKFMLEYVQRESFYARHGELADGNRKAKRIQTEDFLAFPIAVPDQIAEQQKIADCLTSLDEAIAAQGRKVEALKAHKKGLMQHLFPEEDQTLPRLRFPEFRGGPEWEKLPLGDLLSEKPAYGVNAAALPYSAELPAYVRITDIDDDGNFIGAGRASVEVTPTADNSLAEGDIVLARTGASVGKSYRYRCEDGPLVFAGFLIRVRPDARRLVSAFLGGYLASEPYWDWVRATSARSGQPGINGSEYASLPLPVPSLKDTRGVAEQQRIADCLTSLDAAIATASTALATLKTHKKGLMQGLFPAARRDGGG